jgi:hypothetical protein
MARIRGVKPELFRHEGLQDLGAQAMLIFIGLFTQSDKEGRFCWNVRQLKLDLLPFIDYDLGVTLSALSEAGFIEKYVINGKSYGVIPGFKTHQYTTGKEPDSKLPAPPNTNPSMTRTCPVNDESLTGHTEERISGHTGSESESESESELGSEGEKDLTDSATAQPAGDVFELPLKDGSSYGVPQELYAEYCKSYPTVGVMDQLGAMRAWIISNPGKRSTRAGIKRFINSWLSRDRDRPDGARKRSPRAENFDSIDYAKSYEFAPGENVGLL